MYLSAFVVGACCRRAIPDMYLYLMLMVYYWYVSAFYYWNVFFVKKGIAVRNSNSSHADGVFAPLLCARADPVKHISVHVSAMSPSNVSHFGRIVVRSYSFT